MFVPRQFRGTKIGLFRDFRVHDATPSRKCSTALSGKLGHHPSGTSSNNSADIIRSRDAMPQKPAFTKMKVGQPGHQIQTDILREKRAVIVATLSRQLGGSRRISPCESKRKRLRSPANIGNLDDAKKDSGVGQLLSTAAVHGALVRSETIAMPSKMSGSENADRISRRRLRMIIPACTLRPASDTRTISESTLA